MPEETQSLEPSITDERVAVMRGRIGEAFDVQPWDPMVTQGGIRHFVLGVGDDNPLWWENGYASRTRWGKQIAPPTYLYTFLTHMWRPPWEEGMRHGDSFFPGVLGFWAGDRWRWYDHAHVGETVTTSVALADVDEKVGSFTGGRQVAQTLKSEFRADDGRLIADWHNTVIWMEKAAARERARYQGIDVHYTEEDRRRFAEQYASEPLQRQGARTRYFDDVGIGDPLLTLLKGPLTMTNVIGFLIGWHTPMCPTNRIVSRYLERFPGSRLFNPETGVEDIIDAGHWDPYFVRQAGLPRAFDIGAQRISWLAHLLSDWHGDDGFLEALDVRIRQPNFLGDVSWLTGQVTGLTRREESGAVECELKITNQREDVTADARATVVLPLRETG
jgi:acyl dehydratase